MCGDEFVETAHQDGYDRRGNPVIRRWKKCPRSIDTRYEYDRYQTGRCTPLYPMACFYEVQAWNEHRPWWGACRHDSVSEDGDACWLKDRTQLTLDHQPSGAPVTPLLIATLA